MALLKVGDRAPEFTLPSHLDIDITLSDLKGKAVVMAFFPLAWTPVCTVQIPSYESDLEQFVRLNTQVLGISVDSVPSLKRWTETLGGIHFPVLSDFYPHGEVAEKFGVLQADGRSERALFIIDEEGIIRYVDVHDIGQQPINAVLFNEIKKLRPNYVEPVAKMEPNLPHGGIVMYCTKWCPDCRRARLWLAENHLTYTEVDVMSVVGAGEQVRKWTGGDLVTPTFDIDGQIVIDYDLPKLKEILKIS
jgi:peroxiredoxin (alkyl hydroperoxide reductase subunit C)